MAVVNHHHCVCGCTDLATYKNAGWDIDETGEENQHEDWCRECGKKRLWADRLDYETGEWGVWYGEWSQY